MTTSEPAAIGTGGTLLHTMMRIGDPEKVVRFYQDILGMKLLRVEKQPEYEFDLYFMGYEDETQGAVLEFTFNYGKTEYSGTSGERFGHFCVGCDDVPKAVAECKKRGVEVTYEQEDGFMAFITGPSGEEIEILNKKMMYDMARKAYSQKKSESSSSSSASATTAESDAEVKSKIELGDGLGVATVVNTAPLGTEEALQREKLKGLVELEGQAAQTKAEHKDFNELVQGSVLSKKNAEEEAKKSA